MNNLKTTYNRIAKDWSNDHKNDDWWINSTLSFLNYLRRCDKILDAGCGAGISSKYLSEKGFKVVGMDFSDEMVKLARKYCTDSNFHVKDIMKPINLGRFNGIYAKAVLLHVPKDKVSGVLKNFRNSLRDGGYLYLAVKEQKKGQEQECVIEENDYGYSYKRFFSFFTMPELGKYIESAGMHIVKDLVVGKGETKWLIIMARKEEASGGN